MTSRKLGLFNTPLHLPYFTTLSLKYLCHKQANPLWPPLSLHDVIYECTQAFVRNAILADGLIRPDFGLA